MTKFAEAFRTARLKTGTKFREIAEATGLSIGFLSDLDSGRRHPPELIAVQRIQRCLGVTDDHLIKLAAEERALRSPNLDTIFRSNPRLEELMLRGDELTAEQLEEIIAEMKSRIEAKRPPDGKLFLNRDNMRFLGDYYETPGYEGQRPTA
jgi:transcriptional regulator with XRE-family HTH domain